MKIKGKRWMTKSEVGELLKELGEELIKTGQIIYPRGFGKAKEIRPPEKVDVEVEYKEKRDKKKFEIELKWHDASSRGDLVKTERPPKFKELKKELKHALYEVEVALKSGDMDTAKENFAHFNDLNRRFREQSEPEWETNIKGQDKIIKDLDASLNEEDLENSIFLVEKLWKYKKACHRLFKG